MEAQLTELFVTTTEAAHCLSGAVLSLYTRALVRGVPPLCPFSGKEKRRLGEAIILEDIQCINSRVGICAFLINKQGLKLGLSLHVAGF